MEKGLIIAALKGDHVSGVSALAGFAHFIRFRLFVHLYAFPFLQIREQLISYEGGKKPQNK